MKLSLLLLIPFFIFSYFSNAQDCPAFTVEGKGRVQVNLLSEEDCFTVKYRGSEFVTANTRYATFFFNNGSHNLTIIMDDGTELTKKVFVSPDNSVFNFNIKKKKKGKYAVKLDMFNSQLTAEAQQELNSSVEDSQAKNNQEMKARQEASDKEWNDKLAAQEAEREERKAKEKAEQEKVEKERDAEWNAYQEEKFAEKEEVNGNSNSSSSGNSGNSFGLGGSGPTVEFVLHYKGKPVCDWDILISHADEDSEVVVAKGKTDSQGAFKSSYSGLLDVPFKVTGSREGSNGDVKWSVDGFWYLNDEEVKAGKIILDIIKFEEYLSKGGMSGMGSLAVSYAKYGLTLHCE